MKQVILSLGLVLGGLANAASAPQTELACWDATFAYNVFRVEKTASRVYVSLRGASILAKGKDFYLGNAFESPKVNDYRQRSHFVVSFANADCKTSGDTLTCEAGDLTTSNQNQAVYLERDLDDLGKPVHLVSKFGAQHLKVEASPNGLTLTKTIRYIGTGETIVQALEVKKYQVGSEVIPLNCDAQGANFSPKVSQKLVDHLEP